MTKIRLPLVADRLHQLATGLGVGSEEAEHRRRDGLGICLFNPAHDHAEMRRFNDDGHPARSYGFPEARGDLFGEPFLDLKSATKAVNQFGQMPWA